MKENLKVITVRVPDEDYRVFAANAIERGITPAESLRALIAWSNTQVLQGAGLIDVAVEVELVPKNLRDMDPGRVAWITATVATTASLPVDLLDRVVFVSPEFFDERGHEPFRVDSFYFHRVCSDVVCIASERVNRNVLSFRLANGKWRAGVYVYQFGADEDDVLERVNAAVVKAIRDTLAGYLSGSLPAERLLSEADLREYREMHPGLGPFGESGTDAQ